jgi:hypothetical protein
MLGRQLDRSITEASMARLVNQMVVAVREKPSRCAYVFGALVLSVILFTMADFLPAPYDYPR